MSLSVSYQRLHRALIRYCTYMNIITRIKASNRVGKQTELISHTCPQRKYTKKEASTNENISTSAEIRLFRCFIRVGNECPSGLIIIMCMTSSVDTNGSIPMNSSHPRYEKTLLTGNADMEWVKKNVIRTLNSVFARHVEMNDCINVDTVIASDRIQWEGNNYSPADTGHYPCKLEGASPAFFGERKNAGRPAVRKLIDTLGLRKQMLSTGVSLKDYRASLSASTGESATARRNFTGRWVC